MGNHGRRKFSFLLVLLGALLLSSTAIADGGNWGPSWSYEVGGYYVEVMEYEDQSKQKIARLKLGGPRFYKARDFRCSASVFATLAIASPIVFLIAIILIFQGWRKWRADRRTRRQDARHSEGC